MLKLLIFLHIVALLVFRVFGRTIGLSNHCNLDSDHTKLGRCLRPWLDLWEMIRVQEAHASNILFPIPFYSRESVLFLCSAYLNSRGTCMTAKVLENCYNNEMITFVQSHMRYYCGNRAKIAFGEFDCLRGALISNHSCWRYIEGIPSPTHQIGKCKGMPKFFDCISSTVRSRCGRAGVHILVDAITSFGCALRKEMMQESARFLAKVNSTGELTEEAGKKYIRAELSAALPILDDEKIGKTVTHLYDMMPTVKSGPGMIVVGEFDGAFSTPKNHRNKKKTDADYRRTPARKPDLTLDYVEENTFLESDPTIEIAFDGDNLNITDIPMQKTTKCTKKQEAQIAQCYALLIKLWDKIQNRHRSSGDILLPFYNYNSEELNNLCDIYDGVINNCLSNNLINNCQKNDLVEFVEEHFGVMCTEMIKGKMSTNFKCLRKVFTEKQECTDIIRNSARNGALRCAQMSDFFDCLQSTIQRQCPPRTISFFVDMISNFGCAVHLNQLKLTDDDEVDDKKLEIYKKTNPQMETSKIQDDEIFPYQLSGECTRDMRLKVRKCVQPLFLTWKDIREQRPLLKNTSFPMYKYTRIELLELCDAYANTFLCAGFETIMRCLNDQMIRFSRDHFGYICTPKNIERFMKHYDCIVEVGITNDEKCGIFITGTAKPGNDIKKCHDLRQYHDCMRQRIIQRCRNGALKEFEESIIEYGCSVSRDGSVHSSDNGH